MEEGDIVELTDLMTCKNCKYYEEGSCLLKSNAFSKFNVTDENTCSDWEKTDLFKKEYDLIIQVLDKYMDMKEEDKIVVAVWIIGALMHDKFESYPYLFLNAMRGSGKTRLLKIIRSFTEGDILASLTEAVLFRTTGALCIDEFEGLQRKGNENLRELLNSAYKKGTKVKRMTKKKGLDGEKMVVEEFEPYRPICMANIYGMEDVLGDRCIQIILEKSNNVQKTRLVEIWEKETTLKLFQKTNKNRGKCSLCSVVTINNIYTNWNDFITSNYTNYTNNINYNNYTNYTKMFEKIRNSNIDGRFLEIGLPLFLIAELIGEEVFDKLINYFGEIVNKKQEESLTENSDVALYDFLSQEVETKEFVFVNELTRKFKEFSGIQEEWLNDKWLGRALKRLNLTFDKKRLGRGVVVKIDYKKAQEKIKMFQQRGNMNDPISNNR